MRRTQTSSAPRPARTAERHAAPPPARHSLRGEFVAALVVALALLLATVAWERSPDGEALAFLAYDRQQRSAAAASDDTPLPVVVVDITAIGPVSRQTADGVELVTPRAPLTRTLQQLAGRDAAAIGVDVDLSPRNGTYLPEDPAFYHACQVLRSSAGQPVPAFLGVLRTMGLPPERRLGGGALAPLAAGISAPRRDTRKMAAWTRARGSDRLCSLSARLAAASPDGPVSQLDCPPTAATPAAPPSAPRGNMRRPPAWPPWLAEQFEERPVGPELEASEFLVDYSAAERVLRDRIRVLPTGDLPSDAELPPLAGKLVLVGYATPDRTTDMVRVPGHENEVPGIVALACAVDTLVARPFYELRPLARLFLDVLLAAILLGVVFGVRRAAERRHLGAVKEHRLEAFTILGLVAVAYGLGSVLPIAFRLVWSDYLLVIVVLLLHPYAGHVWEWLCEVAPGAARRMWREEVE